MSSSSPISTPPLPSTLGVDSVTQGTMATPCMPSEDLNYSASTTCNRAGTFQSDPVLHHLLVHILGMTDNSPIAHFLKHNGVIPSGSLADLLSLPFQAPELEPYKHSGSTTTKYLGRADATKLQYLLFWSLEFNASRPSPTQWLATTRADFDAFRLARKIDFDHYRVKFIHGNTVSSNSTTRHRKSTGSILRTSPSTPRSRPTSPKSHDHGTTRRSTKVGNRKDPKLAPETEVDPPSPSDTSPVIQEVETSVADIQSYQPPTNQIAHEHHTTSNADHNTFSDASDDSIFDDVTLPEAFARVAEVLDASLEEFWSLATTTETMITPTINGKPDPPGLKFPNIDPPTVPVDTIEAHCVLSTSRSMFPSTTASCAKDGEAIAKTTKHAELEDHKDSNEDDYKPNIFIKTKQRFIQYHSSAPSEYLEAAIHHQHFRTIRPFLETITSTKPDKSYKVKQVRPKHNLEDTVWHCHLDDDELGTPTTGHADDTNSPGSPDGTTHRIFDPGGSPRRIFDPGGVSHCNAVSINIDCISDTSSQTYDDEAKHLHISFNIVLTKHATSRTKQTGNLLNGERISLFAFAKSLHPPNVESTSRNVELSNSSDHTTRLERTAHCRSKGRVTVITNFSFNCSLVLSFTPLVHLFVTGNRVSHYLHGPATYFRVKVNYYIDHCGDILLKHAKPPSAPTDYILPRSHENDFRMHNYSEGPQRAEIHRFQAYQDRSRTNRSKRVLHLINTRIPKLLTSMKQFDCSGTRPTRFYVKHQPRNTSTGSTHTQVHRSHKHNKQATLDYMHNICKQMLDWKQGTSSLLSSREADDIYERNVAMTAKTQRGTLHPPT